jgi:hypothetical protein
MDVPQSNHLSLNVPSTPHHFSDGSVPHIPPLHVYASRKRPLDRFATFTFVAGLSDDSGILTLEQSNGTVLILSDESLTLHSQSSLKCPMTPALWDTFPTDSYTLITRIKAQTVPFKYTILSTTEDASLSYGVLLNLNVTNGLQQIQFTVWNDPNKPNFAGGGYNTSLTNDHITTPNTYYHIAQLYDSASATHSLYIDGVLVYTGSVRDFANVSPDNPKVYIHPSTSAWYINEFNNGSLSNDNVTIDKWELYPFQLSQDQIVANISV